MFAPLISLFRLVSGTDRNERTLASEYLSHVFFEEVFHKRSSLATISIFEHTLYLLRPSNTEIEKQEMVKLTSKYISLEIELFELLVAHYGIFSNDNETETGKIKRLIGHRPVLQSKYSELLSAFSDLKEGFYEDTQEKESQRSDAAEKVITTLMVSILKIVNIEGDSRLLETLNLLVSVYKYRRSEYEHALANIDFEFTDVIRQKIARLDQFISDNQELCLKGESIRDTVRDLDIKPV